MHITRRGGLALLFLTFLLAACAGSTATSTTDADPSNEGADSAAENDAESEDDAGQADDAASDEAETTTTTVAAKAETTTTVADDDVDQNSNDSDGPMSLAAIGNMLFGGGGGTIDGVTKDESDCLKDRLDSDLPNVDFNSDFDTLSLEDQAVAIELLFDCAPESMRAEFDAGFDTVDAVGDLPFGQDTADCMFDELARDDDEQPLRILALAHMAEDLPAPEESVDAGAAFFSRCFDFGQAMSAGMDLDGLDDVIDAECLTTVFDADGTQALFAAMLRDPNALDGDAFPEELTVIFSCFRFGELMAQQFAGLAELTPEEISCIDDAFGSAEAVEAMTSDGDMPDSLLEDMFTCFTPETLVALGG